MTSGEKASQEWNMTTLKYYLIVIISVGLLILLDKLMGMKENLCTFKNTPQDISKCTEKKLEGLMIMCDRNSPNSNSWFRMVLKSVMSVLDLLSQT